MSEPYIVNMDRYWNYVALPLFLVTRVFGLITLFSMNPVQFAAPERVRAAIDSLRRQRPAAASTRLPILSPAQR
jgi:hypothetical protein